MRTDCLVTDGCVSVKWVVQEADSDKARDLLKSLTPIYVPNVWLVETAWVLQKKDRRGELGPKGAWRDLVRDLQSNYGVSIVDQDSYIEAALDLAHATGCGVQDGIYLQLAIELDCELITADGRLINALKASPAGRAQVHRVRLL